MINDEDLIKKALSHTTIETAEKKIKLPCNFIKNIKTIKIIA